MIAKSKNMNDCKQVRFLILTSETHQHISVFYTLACRHDRSSIVLATKVRNGISALAGNRPNEIGLTPGRGSIMTNLERSLKRLQTDYIDLYYVRVHMLYGEHRNMVTVLLIL